MRMKEPPTACSLLKRLEVEKQLQYTSEAQGVEEEVETQYQAVVKVQSIIRGRATQVLVIDCNWKGFKYSIKAINFILTINHTLFQFLKKYI